MNFIELEAGKRELVQVISEISNPEILAKARKALYHIVYSPAKAEEEVEEEEDLMPGGTPALQFTEKELNEHIDKSLQAIAEGRTHTSAEVHRRMEEKFPFLCK